jgi:hypothetical protein
LAERLNIDACRSFWLPNFSSSVTAAPGAPRFLARRSV